MDFHNIIDPEKLTELSLYLHVPFCVQKCDYCAFYSISQFDEDLKFQWLRAMQREMQKWSKQITDCRIKTIFIGGGTPSVLTGHVLKELLNSLNIFNLSELEEFSIESNPESLTKEFLEICYENRVNRLSLGIQSLNEEELQILGRNCSLKQSKTALALIAKHWKGQINLDFITGTPGQSRKSLLDSLDEACDLCNPGHLSLYSLTPDEKTKLAMGFSQMRIEHHPGLDTLWIQAYYHLQSKGFMNYEIANFAREKQFCAHNLAYWKLDPYLGIGPGAYSTLPGKSGPLRMDYISDVLSFITKHEMTIEHLSVKEFLADTMIMGWRLKKGIEKKIFAKRFGCFLEDLLPEYYESLRAQKKIIDHSHCYMLRLKTRLFLDPLLIDFLEALDNADFYKVSLDWP